MRRVGFAVFAAVCFVAVPSFAGSPRVEPVTVTKIVQTSGAGATTTLRINVASGGCTRADDFRLVVTQRAGDQLVHFDRLKQDLCERDDPQGSVVELTTTAIVPGKPVVVDNPLFVGAAIRGILGGDEEARWSTAVGR